jgi:prevent-host-death family protein
METVGAFDAKTHLAALLERVEKGETFLITRHGRPVAQLSPVERRDPERIARLIERFEAVAQEQRLDGDWREFRDAGRKW